MKTATTVCGKCGAEIPADARQGACPACLLETGLGLLMDEPGAGDGLSAVAAHSAEAAAKAGSAKEDDPGGNGVQAADRKNAVRPARNGESVPRRTKMLGDFGDYELLEEIGRGGQGVVYRARQKSLNRTVAVKVIGLGHWATEAHVKRFQREAEAAASLEHPGIVPIHEVGERDGSCYFSMKFIEGGQLDQVVKRTPISIRQAAELIAKLVRTVHYAHEHGILHRDIKPGNILLDQKGEPHLTDFGLARLVETESTVTRTKEVLGTPSYMAPEQAIGETGKLTSATDVYGLGAVLYQLLTGQPPFAGGTTYETIRLLLDTEPRPPRLLNPKIDRDLSTICLKCLEKDPQRRYSSALALAGDLERWLEGRPIKTRRVLPSTHAWRWSRRNPSTAVLVTLLLALAAGLSLMVWNRQPAVLIPKSVAVLPFENLSPDPNNAYFAEGIQEEILTRLAGIADLKVISRKSTQRYQRKPRNLSQIAKQLGVANILEGSVEKAGDQVRVSVQLINAETDAHLWANTYDRKLTDIFGVESEIAKRIAESLQAKLTGREKQALAAKPTNNRAAKAARQPIIASPSGGCTDGTWTPTTLINAPTARYVHTAVWTGSEMIVWGGSADGLLNTGGRYNPSTDSWTATTTTNAPSARSRHTAVWTGSEMIVWGGGADSTGGRYNPSTDSWSATSPTKAPSARHVHTAVWTGSEMIVWGGLGGGVLNTGGRYDPSTDSWSATSITNSPSARRYHTAVWTGSEMIVWGGDDTIINVDTGGRYDPNTNRWTATSTANAPEIRGIHTAVWTNSEMIVWGGGIPGTYFNTGGRYSPGMNSWTATSTTSAPSGRIHHTVVWTGSEMIVWGGQAADLSPGEMVWDDFFNTGGRYCTPALQGKQDQARRWPRGLRKVRRKF
jgi:serine/threonine protein kinase/N-acetylneuraminic acid mutarotase